jgi:hypothetical protein
VAVRSAPTSAGATKEAAPHNREERPLCFKRATAQPRNAKFTFLDNLTDMTATFPAARENHVTKLFRVYRRLIQEGLDVAPVTALLLNADAGCKTIKQPNTAIGVTPDSSTGHRSCCPTAPIPFELARQDTPPLSAR